MTAFLALRRDNRLRTHSLNPCPCLSSCALAAAPARCADSDRDNAPPIVQVGGTPSFIELPRNHCDRMKLYKAADAPISLCPPEKDAKARFFWRLGPRPEASEFAELNAPPVLPAGFPQWADVSGAGLLAGALRPARTHGWPARR